MLPQKILNLDPLRLLLMQSGTRLLFNTCDKTITTTLNSKISVRGEIVAWRGGGIPGIPGLPSLPLSVWNPGSVNRCMILTEKIHTDDSEIVNWLFVYNVFNHAFPHISITSNKQWSEEVKVWETLLWSDMPYLLLILTLSTRGRYSCSDFVSVALMCSTRSTIHRKNSWQSRRFS